MNETVEVTLSNNHWKAIIRNDEVTYVRFLGSDRSIVSFTDLKAVETALEEGKELLQAIRKKLGK